MHTFQILFMSLLVSVAMAHAGNLAQGMAARRDFALLNKMDLSHCREQMQSIGVFEQIMERRAKLATHLLKGRSLKDRDISPLLGTSHRADDGLTLNTPVADLFAVDKFHGCVLSPEVTEGPFYIEGEYIRGDLVEDQAGVPLYLDLVLIDTATCRNTPGVYIEIWGANALGIYGGVQQTWLRGVQMTQPDGSVSFSTIFPGHYNGRTNHLHIMSHLHAQPLPNGTIQDHTATHAGQIFFDQDLVDLVELQQPYVLNAQQVVKNEDDVFLAQEAAMGDPLVEWAFLDDNNIYAGILAWLAFGVNMTTVREIAVEGTFYDA